MVYLWLRRPLYRFLSLPWLSRFALLAGLPVLLSVHLSINSYAATSSNAHRKASSSDALRDALNELNGIEDEDYDSYTLEDYDLLDLLELLFSYVTGPGVTYNNVPESLDEENQPEDIEAYVFSEDDLPDGVESLAISGNAPVVNAVRYSIRFNNTNYTLLLPSDAVDKVYIDDNGYLWNMSTANVSGRVFTGDFDPTANTGYILYLSPCLGNNFTANNNYGSPNYVRRYYWSSGSLRTSDTYGTVLVLESGYPFYQSQTLQYIGIVLIGGILICLWRKSLH